LSGPQRTGSGTGDGLLAGPGDRRRRYELNNEILELKAQSQISFSSRWQSGGILAAKSFWMMTMRRIFKS
jgi:hypothetical protein